MSAARQLEVSQWIDNFFRNCESVAMDPISFFPLSQLAVQGLEYFKVFARQKP
jgi:hypothetical protein